MGDLKGPSCYGGLNFILVLPSGNNRCFSFIQLKTPLHLLNGTYVFDPASLLSMVHFRYCGQHSVRSELVDTRNTSSLDMRFHSSQNSRYNSWYNKGFMIAITSEPGKDKQ